jgi:hypothetical protein
LPFLTLVVRYNQNINNDVEEYNKNAYDITNKIYDKNNNNIDNVVNDNKYYNNEEYSP